MILIGLILAVAQSAADSLPAAVQEEPDRTLFCVAYRDARWSVFELSSSEPEPSQPVLRLDSDAKDLALAPDGRQLCVADARGNLWTLELDGKGNPELLVAGPGAEQPAWSPDGRRVLFIRFRPVPKDDSDLFVVTRSDGGIQALRPLPGLEADPFWSLDGSSALFSRHLRGNRRPVTERIWRLDLKTGQVMAVTASDQSDSFGVVELPASGRLLYASNKEAGYDIWSCNPDGTEASRLTTAPEYEGSPGCSRDGKWLAYERQSRGGTEIWISRIDGTGPRRFSPPGWNCRRPAWGRGLSRTLTTTGP